MCASPSSPGRAWNRRPASIVFEWLDRAIDTLAAHDLRVILCTPTATPPKWLVDQYPDILPVDPQSGRTRGFGSRRHYDFASETYLRESLRITRIMAERYGQHAAVVGWQTDNELCCHDTTLSASPAARDAFRTWCRERYGDIAALNRAWGNVFWSMEYAAFDDIELPVGAVTETSPAHQLAWRRFASDQVVRFHDQMISVLRAHTRDQFITHNFIPMAETAADNKALAKPLDFAAYDNYPLGRTDLQFADMPAERFRRYMRTGHPDFATYYFDQTRALLDRGFWIMEQQPGPVNWARNNPRPAPGMVRFWTLEALAHGADCVCYFRWRQAPFAQEQMHAGLLRPDHSRTEIWPDIQAAMREAEELFGDLPPVRPSVAIITSTASFDVAAIERQSDHYEYNDIQLAWYSTLRSLGVDVDIITDEAPLERYSLILIPGLPIVGDDLVARLAQSQAHIVIGPRSGAKTDEFCVPDNLAPGALQALVPVRVLSVDTLRPDCPEPVTYDTDTLHCHIWREEIVSELEVVASFEDRGPAIVRNDRIDYVAMLPDADLRRRYFADRLRAAGVATYELPEDVRIARRGRLTFAFNYSAEPVELPAPHNATFRLGQRQLGPRDVAAWEDGT